MNTDDLQRLAQLYAEQQEREASTPGPVSLTQEGLSALDALYQRLTAEAEQQHKEQL